MTNIRQQAKLSGLHFTNRANIHKEPEWRPSEWPPLPGGWRLEHTSVVMKHPDKNQGEIVVVLGGYNNEGHDLNSVLLLNVDEHKKVWREGCAMNEGRSSCAAVVCNGSLYAIGGSKEWSALPTIERIGITELVYSSFASNQKNQQWTTLECCLSWDRKGCAAAVVHDRFIVVAGGEGEDYGFLSSVEIIDTSSKSQRFVIAGPHMNLARSSFGMAVIGSRIYVVGGSGLDYLDDEDDTKFDSVEYLEFDDWLTEKQKDTKSMSPLTNSWTIHKDLVLGTPRSQHVVVRVGCCLVVEGGMHNQGYDHRSGEVLDTLRNRVWQLPNMNKTIQGSNVVAISSGIVTIGEDLIPGQTLSLADKNSLCFAGLMALGKAPIRPKLC